MKALITLMQQDQDYHRLEEYETIFKKSILDFEKAGDVRAVVESTHALGLLFKYKPYGVKCSSPLGYSIFLLNPGEGFSFQQHLDFKTELFHFIHSPDDGYGFIAESDDFDSVALRHSIEDWWKGRHREFDKFKVLPKPGHIAKVDRTGIVHTVIGCAIEEYANTSLDMVERLFDQNAGRETVLLHRADILERIRILDIPLPTHELAVGGKQLGMRGIVTVQLAKGVIGYEMHKSADFSAERIAFEPKSEYVLKTDTDFVSLFVSHGNLHLHESNKGISLLLNTTETVILPPDTSWHVSTEQESRVSVLSVDQSKAFL